MLKDLIKIANKLDKHWLLGEANVLDSIIAKYADVLETKDESGDHHIAYHCGKPDIESEFNFNSLGTGEGAGILGPGIYFATDRSIAERYCKYKEEAVMYKAKIPKENIYDPLKGEPKNLRESIISIVKDIEKETGKDPYRGVLPLTHGRGSIGALVKHYGPQKAREILIEAGIIGAVERIGSGLEIALFSPSAALIMPDNQQS
jgi:hypothetical protein